MTETSGDGTGQVTLDGDEANLPEAPVDPTEVSFWCPACDVNFRDPYAQAQRSDIWPDKLFGKCGKCGATIEHEVRQS